MSYQDYSSHWSLDQFLTFLEANQLGTNDEHIVDTISNYHNWNASVPNGSHKWGTIFQNRSYGFHRFTTASELYTPGPALYQFMLGTNLEGNSGNARLELYDGVTGTWYVASGSTINTFGIGLIGCDGTNMRLRNLNSTINGYVNVIFAQYWS